MFEFRSGGRRVSQHEFFKNLERRVIDSAFQQLEDRVRGAASSIVDPATGKHADVFVRRKGDEGLIIRTKGSPAFARELERRLGIQIGAVKPMRDETQTSPQVYFAHASEDHNALAKPLAERMMADGIDVWLDEWEIYAGDSLKRKMEEGLAGCTHFVVLLTPESLGKPWVETEIDAGFVRMIEGNCRFIGVRAGVAISELSPFLRTLRCPELKLDDNEDMVRLLADIHGASRKPQLGEVPRYVKPLPEGLKAWSPSAVAVAEYLVCNSKNAESVLDPQATVAEVAAATGLPDEDVRLGVLDLNDNGLIEETQTLGCEDFWPKTGLFVEFDRYFMGFNNEEDAVAVARWLINGEFEEADAESVAKQFAWSPRRLNSALGYLEEAKAIDSVKCLDGKPYIMSDIQVTNRTRRFVRDHS